MNAYTPNSGAYDDTYLTWWSAFAGDRVIVKARPGLVEETWTDLSNGQQYTHVASFRLRDNNPDPASEYLTVEIHDWEPFCACMRRLSTITLRPEDNGVVKHWTGINATHGEVRFVWNPVDYNATSVAISDHLSLMAPGQSYEFQAIAQDYMNRYIPGRLITWSSSNPSVATVGSGWVSAHADGFTTITATVDGRSSSRSLQVQGIYVTIEGPSLARPGPNTSPCWWHAVSSSEAVAPLSYEWSWNYDTAVEGTEEWIYAHARASYSDPNAGTLHVKVTDAAGKVGTAIMSITINEVGPACGYE